MCLKEAAGILGETIIADEPDGAAVWPPERCFGTYRDRQIPPEEGRMNQGSWNTGPETR